jgi:hypothetical protein
MSYLADKCRFSFDGEHVWIKCGKVFRCMGCSKIKDVE